MSQNVRRLSQRDLELSKDPCNDVGIEYIGPNSTEYQYHSANGQAVETEFSGSERKERINLSRGAFQERGREHYVVLQWLLCVNPMWGTDYEPAMEVPKEPSDAVVVRRGDSKQKLRLQLTSSDYDSGYRQRVVKNKVGERIETGSAATCQRLEDAISVKQRKYGRDGSRDLILILDAWPGLTQRDVGAFLAGRREFIQNCPFKQVWVVAIEADFVRQIK